MFSVLALDVAPIYQAILLVMYSTCRKSKDLAEPHPGTVDTIINPIESSQSHLHGILNRVLVGNIEQNGNARC